MDANELANRVAHEMLAGEGTGPAWGIRIEEARADYARISMVVRPDMLNSHGIAHGGMIFAPTAALIAWDHFWACRAVSSGNGAIPPT